MIASRRAKQVDTQQVVDRKKLVPPPKYSLSQVKQATASPSKQDDFMNELKAWHMKHVLRPVPDEEKQRPKRASELAKVDVAQESQTRNQEKKTATKSSKWGKLSKIFKRKKGSKKKPVPVIIGDSTSETKPTLAPHSLVEQRKAALESFFVAYTNTIQKDKKSNSSKSKKEIEDSPYDETEEGTEVQLSVATEDANRGASTFPISVPPTVVLPMKSKKSFLEKEHVSELSSSSAVNRSPLSRERASTASNPSFGEDRGSTHLSSPESESSSCDSKKENSNKSSEDDDEILDATGVSWKDIQPKKVVVAKMKQPSSPKQSSNTARIARPREKVEGTTTKPRGNKSRHAKDVKPKPDKKRRSSNDKSEASSSTPPEKSSHKPGYGGATTLFGSSSSRHSNTMSEAERRRKERKARLSQTLF